MTTAAIYARFSSSSQHDDSIDIQVEQCLSYIERHGWTAGEVYADYAMTGTNDDRPGFRRCIGDGVEKFYDVLVFYKLDRFARNVEISQKYLTKLKQAGIVVHSVREGCLGDSPEEELMTTVNAGFAAYYSQNLSVLIRNGNQKKAEQRKACGRRVYGYDVDENDFFVVNEAQADVVRRVFSAYANGQSVNQIAKWMEEEGVRTKHGNPYSKNSIAKMLKNEAYAGVYVFNGVRDYEHGMPAIVSWELFDRVQERMEDQMRAKRRSEAADYKLTGRLFCLKCGTALGGSSGFNRHGKKYTYYKCREPKGCGFTISQELVERTVFDALQELLDDKPTLEAMIAYVVEEAKKQPSLIPSLERELAELKRRRNNLLKSIEEGAPYDLVSERMSELNSWIDSTAMQLAKEKANHNIKFSRGLEGAVRTILESPDFLENHTKEIMGMFIYRIYVDEDTCILVFNSENNEGFAYSSLRSEGFEKGVKIKGETADESGVRLEFKWWSNVNYRRTLYFTQGRFFLLIRTSKS